MHAISWPWRQDALDGNKAQQVCLTCQRTSALRNEASELFHVSRRAFLPVNHEKVKEGVLVLK